MTELKYVAEPCTIHDCQHLYESECVGQPRPCRPRLGGPYNPLNLPHRVRTLIIVAVLVVGLAWGAAALFGPANVELPREVYQPSYPVTEPGWLEPTVVPHTPGETP